MVRRKRVGWKTQHGKKVPGLIDKFRAEKAMERRMKVSIFQPGGSVEGDDGEQRLTVGETLEDPTPTPELELEEKEQDRERWQSRLAEVDAKIAEWEQRIPKVKDVKKQETLKHLLNYVKKCRSEWTGEPDEFKVPLLRFRRRWSIRADEAGWFETELGLKQKSAIVHRLLKVWDLLREHGLDCLEAPLSVQVSELERAVAELREKARWMWFAPTDKATVKVLCDWFEAKLNAARSGGSSLIEIAPLLSREQSQYVLDESASQYLQRKMRVSQNAVRKRVDRVRDILTDWGLVEVIKDE